MSDVVAIPPWSTSGLLPPIDASMPASFERSPYSVSLSEFVLRFATSVERCRILDGFLRYRGKLHAVGLASGFQWLDGSFLENVEEIEGRSPQDLDVTTFFRLPPGVTQAQILARDPAVFPQSVADSLAFKTIYNVDAYLVDLGMPSDDLVAWSVYWYSMWSHRRDDRWKGYLRVDLAPTEDAVAAGHLIAFAAGGTP